MTKQIADELTSAKASQQTAFKEELNELMNENQTELRMRDIDIQMPKPHL